MLFNSYPFLFVYLPLVLGGFFLVGRKWGPKAAILFLALASLVFYSFWNINDLPILLGSILFNFFVGRKIKGAGAGKKWLVFGVCANLTLLGFFKYGAFFVFNFNQLFHTQFHFPEVTLPLGISFFTFTQIAYLVDAGRGSAVKTALSHYALFVTIFPHLIAGPILQYRKIIPQFFERHTFIFSSSNQFQGLVFLVLGLGKKVLIADNLAQWADPVFSNALNLSFCEAWIGVLAYAMQLYFDFSGYSDMAVGLGRMFNMEIPINFNSPFKATSIINFWERWHISLSQFLREYLYIPLGGNRLGEVRRYVNIFITMLLGGIWHGAGFTFILWGAWHGLFIMLNNFWRKIAFVSVPKPVGWALTFLVFVLGVVFFRGNNYQDIVEIFKSMAGLKERILPIAYATKLPWLSTFGFQFKGNNLGSIQEAKKALLFILSLLPCVVFAPNTQEIVGKIKPTLLWALGLSLISLFVLSGLNQVSKFLYFQF